ncbi:CLUMA_CG011823, isoform A [Clunio marinus]|uniref:CLUMA_CG011823, isoform A n=1 Tax=Clunio marinus TaxID=568069 RepID=A0A1J1IFD9_9DIPT|nr:CLUMA_CG011823, isoform A [Clunio marinus]
MTFICKLIFKREGTIKNSLNFNHKMASKSYSSQDSLITSNYSTVMIEKWTKYIEKTQEFFQAHIEVIKSVSGMLGNSTAFEGISNANGTSGTTFNVINKITSSEEVPISENSQENVNSFVKQEPISTSTPKRERKRVRNDSFVTGEEIVDDHVLPTELYCCDCKRKFIKGNGEFTRHIRETTCRPYKCHCGKLFRKRSTMKSHQMIHTEPSFKCHCGSIFRCTKYLRNHQRRIHGNNAIECQQNNAKRQCLAMDSAIDLQIKVKEEEIKFDTSELNPMDLLSLHLQED